MWEYRGHVRPSFAVEPQAGQESVWDYPRPPQALRCARRVEVRDGDHIVADSTRTYRVLETASPPTFYIPADDVKRSRLVEAPGRSICEWKGIARYWALSSDPKGAPVAWSYPEPCEAFAMLRGHLSFYPARVACFIAGERVRAQAGNFYGGWITRDVVGPFKGDPGTHRW